jgi:hypothetical protein
MLDNLNGDDVIHGRWPPRPAIPRLDPPLVEVVRSRPGQLTVDFAKSIDACYAAVRERMKAGGRGWEPKMSNEESTT